MTGPGTEAALIRPAKPDDAPAIAAVHVAAGSETSTGLLPDAVIAAGTLEKRRARWACILGDPAAAPGVAIPIAEARGALVGFGAGHARRSADLAASGFAGEISAPYVLRAGRRRGIGRGLMGAIAAHLRAVGHRGAELWVLRDTATARHFHEGLGGVVTGENEEVRPEGRLVEAAYGWHDLAFLATACDPGSRRGRGLLSGPRRRPRPPRPPAIADR